ncbi:MAG TPA: CBS domain-containing protein [Candidatus Hypogeohydataceae bacterium YC38]|nr:CBS domain-containing protein [Candidatus Brocadiales bacterium]
MAEKALKDVRFSTVSQVMTKDVVFIDGNKTVADAIKLMKEKKVSSLVVNRRTHEDAWGIVTRKDVVSKIVDPGKNPRTVKVFEIMSKPLITVSPSLALKYCARLFNNAGIRRAPVFDGKEIIGIVSNTNIFNAIKI